MNLLWMILLFVVIIVLIACLIALLYVVSGLKRELEHQSLDQSVQLDEHFQRESQDLQVLSQRMSQLSREFERSQSNLVRMEDQMDSISSVMAHPKRRGNYGEMQLESIIAGFLGESRKLFERQYMLDNGKIADGVLFIAAQDRLLCIDSKFPMENFVRFDKSGNEKDRREFLRNMKSHIDAISGKYITEQTLPIALLFLPGEGIYSWICANEEELIRYAYSKGVLLSSPTTLVGILSVLLASTNHFYQAKNFQNIQNQLSEMEKDFDSLILPLKKALSQQKNQLTEIEKSLAAFEKVQNDLQKVIKPDPHYENLGF